MARSHRSFRFETEEEVLQRANDTIFVLASHFYARDIGRITRVQEQLEYGMVGVNNGLISNEMAPFAESSNPAWAAKVSRHGLDDYNGVEYICLRSKVGYHM